MKPINPTIEHLNKPKDALRQAQSVYKSLNGGIEIAEPTGQDPTGVYNRFTQSNQSGTMIRIGAHGSAEPIQWPAAANTPLAINHQLLKQPLGFHVTDVDAAAKIYRVSGQPLNANFISLATDTPSCNATVFIF